ncbi:AraC family transcriptional regulator ligand-binding domain-containing protein [Thalassotalea psychrophila]|uniref:AraC family transcriptional regulator ligand-binding domain-containing protein n=1 Tax=Thalassotalea psychrophila TaxID=3065647 RepID=A0ABY9U0E8_9GAMM|nr:AraC family transcriptional regulator ligand-binding domain-containing protein [Colwelliaceae bacterium SQ149]
MSDYFSIFHGWMIPISRATEDYGLDFNQVLEHCAIKKDDFRDHESRLSAEKIALIIDYCNQKTNKHDFAIGIAKNFHPGMFHALGYSMMSSSTLKDALLRIARYKKVVSNTCELHVTQDLSTVKMQMDVKQYEDSKRPILNHECIICFAATLVSFCREALNSEFNPQALYLNWPKPKGNLDYLNTFFNCEIHFDSPYIVFEFDASTVNSKLIGGNPLLTQHHEKMLDEYITRLDKSDIVQQVKNNIHELLDLGTPSQTDIAANIGMSLRSLQRQLHEKNTSFREILEQTRKKLALDYITQQHLMFSEIGYLLGFSTVGNFNRAFKRWTNCTPGEYRNSHC